MITFTSWLSQTGIRPSEIAKAVKVSNSTLCRIQTGDRSISAKMMNRLIVYSHKQVAAGRAHRALEPNDFFFPPSEKAAAE
jgi:hypothetical protein